MLPANRYWAVLALWTIASNGGSLLARLGSSPLHEGLGEIVSEVPDHQSGVAAEKDIGSSGLTEPCHELLRVDSRETSLGSPGTKKRFLEVRLGHEQQKQSEKLAGSLALVTAEFSAFKAAEQASPLDDGFFDSFHTSLELLRTISHQEGLSMSAPNHKPGPASSVLAETALKLTVCLKLANRQGLPPRLKVRGTDLVFMAFDYLVEINVYPIYELMEQIFPDRNARIFVEHLASILPTTVPYPSLEAAVWEGPQTKHMRNILASVHEKRKTLLMFQLLLENFRGSLSSCTSYQLLEATLNRIGGQGFMNQLDTSRSSIVQEVAKKLIVSFKGGDYADQGPSHADRSKEKLFAYHILSFILDHSCEELKGHLHGIMTVGSVVTQLKWKELILQQSYKSQQLLEIHKSSVSTLDAWRMMDTNFLCSQEGADYVEWEHHLKETLAQETALLGFDTPFQYYKWFQAYSSLLETHPPFESSDPSVFASPHMEKFSKQWVKYRESLLKSRPAKKRKRFGLMSCFGGNQHYQKDEFFNEAGYQESSRESVDQFMEHSRMLIKMLEWRYCNLVFSGSHFSKSTEVLFETPVLVSLALELAQAEKEFQECMSQAHPKDKTELEEDELNSLLLHQHKIDCESIPNLSKLKSGAQEL